MDKDRQTQCKAILNHMETIGAITPYMALRYYGCFRLGARIWDLKAIGYNIKSKLVRVRRSGKHVAQYTIEI